MSNKDRELTDEEASRALSAFFHRRRSPASLEELAKSIAADLFTNGAGEHAHRLHMVDERERGLGGWGEPFMANRILMLLRAAAGDPPE
jgi:hypothetical protein